MRKLRVIVADDVEIIAKTNKMLVEKNENFEVIGLAKDGKEEYNMILELKPDLVVTDNQMPIMNGTDVIEKINNSDLAFKPKFILVTSDSGMDFMKKCNELGIIQVIRKPVNDSSFSYALEEVYDIIKDEVPESLFEEDKPFEPTKEFKEWHEKYCNDEVVDLKKYFTQADFEIIKKLGIEILDKIYTEREFEVLDGEYILYYYEDNMTDEEKADTKSLEGTGVSREEYNTLLKKFEQINLEHNF